MKDKSVGSVLKTETKVIGIVVICLVITVIGISYALFFDVKGNEKNQIVKAGTLEFSYANGSQITNATNSDCFIPMSKDEALTHSECEYKIGITNTGTLPGNYNISLNSETVDKPIELSKLKVLLKKEGTLVDEYPKAGTETSLVANEKIEAGSVVNYTVQVYVDVENETLTADDDEKNISLKINGDAVVNAEELNPAGPVPATDYIKNIETVENGDGLYAVTHDVSEISTDWNKTEYRYAGENPNNYVLFNNEIWKIIGLVNVKVGNSIEQRVKIIRVDQIIGQKNIGKFYFNIESNNWTKSNLKNMLNGIYYGSETGECYKDSEASQCDFTGNGDLPKGLNDVSRNMIDKEVTWNLGGWSSSNITSSQFYEKERITPSSDENNHPSEWSNVTDEDGKYNGIGLLYPSDYGYSIGGNVRTACLTKILHDYNVDDCNNNSWIKSDNEHIWTISARTNTIFNELMIYNVGNVDDYLVYHALNAWPTLYLKFSVKILPNSKPDQEYGTVDNPFVLQ